ncbi:hypothetical protein B0H10DRAFT_319770 [Mycena sp. CBHHK59/15]|nr:hypothetical protein B0H10DRAFT_319770 [Mycena sp. CBHHK59/15]
MDLSQAMNRPLSSLSIPPSTLSALLRAGYETVQDLDTSTAEQLANDLSIPLPSSQAIFSQRQTQTRALPLTQPASASASSSVRRINTNCVPLDALLGGGLARNHILEISGPPGTPAAPIAVGIVKSFLKDTLDEEVLFLDTQNMTPPSVLRSAIPKDCLARVSHHILHTLPELVVFFHTLPSVLDSQPKKMTPPVKSLILQNIKQTLAKLASRGVTTIVTSHLATKLLGDDGSPATFDTGARAVMVPYLGPTYLPSALSFRVVIKPHGPSSGVFRLLSAPAKGKRDAAAREEPYVIPRRKLLPVSEQDQNVPVSKAQVQQLAVPP